ncbi:SCP-like protein [Ancylostoma caninum]|uniref:SCP-like protein n=1 Tax=Ancylostoma caninum TaxID=29170 RepID=A0A368FG91_ANCCA|nr:SCP-like protein [Ancylostoma caninum]
MNGDPAREALLNLHNQHRAATAKGEVKMKNGKNARKCPMMKKLKYDCDLEKAAYATAERCLTADPNTNNENWFTTTTNAASSKRIAAEQAVKSWYDEIKNGSLEQEPGNQNLLFPRLGVTHFARMVWGTNDKIGCGIHKCNNNWHVVCRYGSGVGIPGNPIYKMGPTCNQCIDTCMDGGLCP